MLRITAAIVFVVGVALSIYCLTIPPSIPAWLTALLLLVGCLIGFLGAAIWKADANVSRHRNSSS